MIFHFLHRALFVATTTLLLTGCGGSSNPTMAGTQPVSHAAWDTQLRRYVSAEGVVDYGGWRRDSVQLNTYLASLSTNAPNEQNWSRDEQLAYWINAYNAFTIRHALRHYPLKSFKDLGGSIPFVNMVWDKKIVPIGGKMYTLNDIEHKIIREKFQEPRIHFALVCAAVSCPRLRNEAYVGARLNAQLDEQTRQFVNDPGKNKLAADKVVVSKIFSWYKGDFTKNNQTLVAFLNRYAQTKIKPDAKVDHLDYNWALNGK